VHALSRDFFTLVESTLPESPEESGYFATSTFCERLMQAVVCLASLPAHGSSKFTLRLPLSHDAKKQLSAISVINFENILFPLKPKTFS
jgi:hypothetical protein